jgi:hypothetical protein
MFFFKICCQSFFFPECAVNHVFFPECAVNQKKDWQHILKKNMIGSTFWEKKTDLQHMMGKT